MEKKEKDCKLPSTISQEVSESKQPLRKEFQSQSSVGLAAEQNRTISISSRDNAPSLNHQYLPVVHWPKKTLFAMELQSPLIKSPSAAVPQVQHAQPVTLHLAPQTMPVWPNNIVSGLNAIGTTDLSWQGPAVMGGSIPASNQAPIASYCYHVSYPFPGFSGPWGPISWWGRPPPSLPPWTYSSPGAFAYDSSLPPPMASSSATSSENFQRGIIKPPTKLSLKHHQLWAAQSAENVQLWVLVGQLQTELADYKSRLMKLESDVLSLKSKVEEPTGHGTGTLLAGKSSKRGRPEEQISSVDRGMSSAKATLESDTKNDVTGASLSSTESEAFGGKNGASINLVGSINDKMFEWNSGTQSGVCGRDLINVKSEQYYNDGSVIGGGSSVGKWSSGNDESAAIGVQNPAAESGKDEDDDEAVDDDDSSSAEDIA